MKLFKEPKYFILVENFGRVNRILLFKAISSMMIRGNFFFKGLGLWIGATDGVITTLSRRAYKSTDNIIFLSKDEYIKRVKKLLTLEKYKDDIKAKEQILIILKYENV